MPDTYLVHGQPCPHGFHFGSIAAARIRELSTEMLLSRHPELPNVLALEAVRTVTARFFISLHEANATRSTLSGQRGEGNAAPVIAKSREGAKKTCRPQRQERRRPQLGEAAGHGGFP
jgi:hypothetical protein